MTVRSALLILALAAIPSLSEAQDRSDVLGETEPLSRLLSDGEANQLYREATSGDLRVVPLHGDDDAALIWELPGLHFEPGDAWLALSCAAGQCQLVHTDLSIERITKQPYDSDPTPGQALQFSAPQTAGATSLIAALGIADGEAVPAWLRPGPVTTYFDGQQVPSAPPTPGSMEASIPLGDGRAALLQPVHLRQRGNSAAPLTNLSMESMPGLDLLLTVDGERQLLGALVFDIDGPGPVSAQRYLRWAGDLDGDGKLDLLIEFGMSDTTQTVLFLSSKAKDGELVGAASGFTYFPIESAGC